MFAIEPDTNNTDRAENGSLGMIEGAKDQTFEHQPLAMDSQACAAQELAASHVGSVLGLFLGVIFSVDSGKNLGMAR